MKKVIKVAGYQGEASVHTRSMDFFINELSKTFDFEYEKDITLLGKKASSLIDMTRNNDIQISYLWSSYYEKLLPEIQLLDLPFYFKNKNEVKTLIDDKFNKFVSEKLRAETEVAKEKRKAREEKRLLPGPKRKGKGGKDETPPGDG